MPFTGTLSQSKILKEDKGQCGKALLFGRKLNKHTHTYVHPNTVQLKLVYLTLSITILRSNVC